MTIDEFFEGNGATNFVDRLASQLGIPSYTIRILDVQEGSVIPTVAITPTVVEEDNSTAT